MEIKDFVLGFAAGKAQGGGGSDDWQNLKNYIESSGTQYIDTGYLITNASEFEMIVSATGNIVASDYPCLFGARGAASTRPERDGICAFQIFNYRNPNSHIFWGGAAIAADSDMAKYYGMKTKYFLKKVASDTVGASIDNCDNIRKYGFLFTGNSTYVGTPTPYYPVHLFGVNQVGTSSNRCVMKLYRFRIFESGTLVHEFIPWQENGVSCLKDTITDDLKYNAGTGEFVYGIDS